MVEDSYFIDLAIRSSLMYYPTAPYSPILLLRCSSLLHALGLCTGTVFFTQTPLPSLNQAVTNTSPTKLLSGRILFHQYLAHSTKPEDGIEVQSLGNIPNEEAGASRFHSRTLGRGAETPPRLPLNDPTRSLQPRCRRRAWTADGRVSVWPWHHQMMFAQAKSTPRQVAVVRWAVPAHLIFPYFCTLRTFHAK
jgi:hypothetical protein